MEGQITKAQELVELGVYAPSEYLNRRNELQGRIQAIQAQLKARPTTTRADIGKAIPAIERVLDAFQYAETAEEKNQLLKSIIAKIVYDKKEVATNAVDSASLMTLTIYPRIVP